MDGHFSWVSLDQRPFIQSPFPAIRTRARNNTRCNMGRLPMAQYHDNPVVNHRVWLTHAIGSFSETSTVHEKGGHGQITFSHLLPRFTRG